MPAIALDRTPAIAATPDGKIFFSVAGDDAQDVFVYQNNRKVFYYRIGENDPRREFSVPLRFREKVNRVTIAVKGNDRERSATAVRYFFYPAGIEEHGEDDRDE